MQIFTNIVSYLKQLVAKTTENQSFKKIPYSNKCCAKLPVILLLLLEITELLDTKMLY